MSVRELFPILETGAEHPAAELPLFADLAWDMDGDRPRFSPNGEPVVATGQEALKGWAANAVRTERYRWEIYDAAYGCELTRLIGQGYSVDAKLAEATRYITEALLVNPYCTAVTVTNAAFAGSTLSADILLHTIYGEVSVHV